MKRISIMLMLALLAALFAGCATDGAGDAAQTPVSKDILEEDVDALGKTVEPVDASQSLRIVSTAPSVTEILFALGCGDSIVGVDVSSTYPAETADIEKVGDYNGFDIEKVIALEPTVVFAGNLLQREQIEQLEAAGINVVAAEATYYEDIAASVTLIGSVVGREAQAAALNEQLAEAEAAAKKKAASFERKPTVYYVMGIGEGGNWTSGEGSFINAMLELAGGMPVTAGSAAEWMDYPIEDLVTDDPDILIVSQWVAEADLLAAAGYSELTAVKNGHYYFVDPEIIERPGPRVTETLAVLQGAIEAYLTGE